MMQLVMIAENVLQFKKIIFRVSYGTAFSQEMEPLYFHTKMEPLFFEKKIVMCYWKFRDTA